MSAFARTGPAFRIKTMRRTAMRAMTRGEQAARTMTSKRPRSVAGARNINPMFVRIRMFSYPTTYRLLRGSALRLCSLLAHVTRSFPDLCQRPRDSCQLPAQLVVSNDGSGNAAVCPGLYPASSCEIVKRLPSLLPLNQNIASCQEQALLHTDHILNYLTLSPLPTVALGQLNFSNVPIHLREFSLAVGNLVEVKLCVASASFAEVCNQPRTGMPYVSYQGLISLYSLIHC
jgi:hypothetical protein